MLDIGGHSVPMIHRDSLFCIGGAISYIFADLLIICHGSQEIGHIILGTLATFDQ